MPRSMKDSNTLGMLGMIGAMLAMGDGMIPSAYELGDTSKGTNGKKPSDFSGKPKEVIPKGCKRYYFDEQGFVTDEEVTIYKFTTIASSEAAAIKKYRKKFK